MKRGSVRASKRTKTTSRCSTIQEDVPASYPPQPENNIKRLSIEVEVSPPGKGTEVWHTESSSGGMSSSEHFAKLSMHEALSTNLFTVQIHLMQNRIRNFQNFPFILSQKAPTGGIARTYQKSTSIYIFLSWIYWLDFVLLDTSCQNRLHTLFKMGCLKQLKSPSPWITFQSRFQSHQATEANYLYSDWWLKFPQSLDIRRMRKFNREDPMHTCVLFAF